MSMCASGLYVLFVPIIITMYRYYIPIGIHNTHIVK